MDYKFTATTYIFDDARTRVLLIPHPRFGLWLPPGGHVEPGETPPEGARREALEECGLIVEIIRQDEVWISTPKAESFERPFLCLLEQIPAHLHPVKGPVAPHCHLDMIYLARPIGGSIEPPARWFTLEEVEALESDVEIFEETKVTIRHIFATAPGPITPSSTLLLGSS
jgi:8-oxo-dGTP pyrophosphatase MutT (NUDIX family)